MKLNKFAEYSVSNLREHWRHFEGDEDDDFYRSDDDAYLNDNLKGNKKKPFDYDDDYYDDEEGYNRYGHGPADDDDDDDNYGDDEPIEEDDMQNLLYLLRTMFRNSGIEDVIVEHKKMDITISVGLMRRERLKDIINVFAVANKLKRDILAQYDSEFEMWESKEGNPVLVFNFYYDEGLDDDMAPF